MDSIDFRASQSDERISQDQAGEQGSLTPARRAALDALEREFHDLLKSPAR